jgi:hypothetical protein
MQLLIERAVVHYQIRLLLLVQNLGMRWPVMHQCAERPEPELVWLLAEVTHYQI